MPLLLHAFPIIHVKSSAFFQASCVAVPPDPNIVSILDEAGSVLAHRSVRLLW